MRTKLGVLAIGCLCVPFFQCGGGDDSTGAQVTDAGSGDATTTDGASPNDAAVTDSGPKTVTVAGSLIGGANADGPLANREVVVIDANGAATKLTSDANGKFGAPNIAVPYDIAVPFTPPDAATPGGAWFYSGISRANPIARGSDYVSATADETPQQTTVTFTTTSCSGCYVWFSGPDDNIRSSGVAGASPYSVTYHWTGSATHSAPFHIYLSNAAGAFTNYIDMPSQPLTASGTTALGTPTLATTTSGTMGVAVTLPTSYVFGGSNVAINHTDGSRIAFGPDPSALASLVSFPQVPGVLIAMENSAYAGNAGAFANITIGEAGAPVEVATNLIAAPSLLTPADAATGITTAQSLTWSAFGATSISQALITRAGNPDIIVYTAAPAVDLGRLAKGDIDLAAASTYNWRVGAGAGYATMDDLMAQNPLPKDTVEYNSNTVSQTFTTQ